jgi:hypothetical protein
LIWLHELASRGSLQGVAFYLKETKFLFAMKVVCPSDPMMKRELLPEGPMGFCAVQPHIEGKWEFNSWEMTMTGVEGYPGSVQRVWNILDEEVAILGGDSAKVFVSGHYQGCMLAFKAGLSYSKTLGGVIGLMGYKRTENTPQAPANSVTPVLSVVGGSDLVCHEDAVQRSHKPEGLYDRKNFVQEVWPE